MPTRILLVGAGAIGAFFGSRLATAPNVLVSALCRSNYKAVKTNGFKVTSPKYGDRIFKPEYIFANPDEARQAKLKWDYLLVATKALPDVGDDSTLLEGLAGEKTSIVIAQNGLGIEEPYLKRFPRTPILSAVTNASAAQPSNGWIQHNRWTKISVGPYLPHLDSAGAEQRDGDGIAIESSKTFVELLGAGGIPDAESYSHADLQFVRWHKIAINSAMNPSAVLSGGCGNQELALDSEAALHLKGVMNEVLSAAPIVLDKALPAWLATPEQIIASVSRNTTGSRPSMWQDWEKGRRMELEVILGNPIRIARQKGVEMARLHTMYTLLRKAQEKRDAGSKL